MLSSYFSIWGDYSLTRALQSTPFQNPGGDSTSVTDGGQKFLCPILDYQYSLWPEVSSPPGARFPGEGKTTNDDKRTLRLNWLTIGHHNTIKKKIPHHSFPSFLRFKSETASVLTTDNGSKRVLVRSTLICAVVESKLGIWTQHTPLRYSIS